MVRRAIRLIPALIVALLVCMLGTSSLALAHGDRDTHAKAHNQRHHKSSKRGERSHGHQRGRHDDRGRSHDRGDDDESDHADDDDEDGGRGASGLDEKWLRLSIKNDLAEIAGGKLAQEKGKTAAVKDLGGHLVADHSKALALKTAVAKKLGIDVPKEPTKTQQWTLRVLKKFSGCQFDRWFADLQVGAHQDAIELAENEIKRGKHPAVRGLAKADLPVLLAHLQHAEAALEEAEDCR